jgi:transaldolase
MLRPSDISPALAARRARLEPVRAAHHPAAHGPRLFADSADVREIEPLVRAGIVDGVTTNPTLLKRAGATSWADAKRIMREVLALLAPGPVSLELTATTPEAMLVQARELAALGENAVIKVPIGGYRALDPQADPHTGLKVLRALWEAGIRTNATLVFNTTQAFWAAAAGASYVSPFLGRLADYCAREDTPGAEGSALYDAPAGRYANTEYVARGGPRADAGTRLVHEIATVFANYDLSAEVLAASVRNPAQISEMLLAGADILTVPAPLLAGVADHPLSDAGMRSFHSDAQVFAAGS